jgi:hypothetical protein
VVHPKNHTGAPGLAIDRLQHRLTREKATGSGKGNWLRKKGNAYVITTEPLGQAGGLHKTRAIGKE